jgi:hypothetical protein
MARGGAREGSGQPRKHLPEDIPVGETRTRRIPEWVSDDELKQWLEKVAKEKSIN